MRRFSISQITTFTASPAEDLATYADAGADGIGIWELKLPARGAGDAQAIQQIEGGGLCSAAIPLIPSILPPPLMEGPSDPSERTERTREARIRERVGPVSAGREI
jgi:hypothetical protein